MGCLASRSAEAEESAVLNWGTTIRLPSAWRVEPALTRTQLSRLRVEFWETRIEGRAEMWQALRFAAECDGGDVAVATLRAAGLRPAGRNGTMTKVYDERGALYEVPIYCLIEPDNLDVPPVCAEFKDAAAAVADL